MSSAQAEPMHEQTADGRDRHSMFKVDGVWTCECGETRNAAGETVERPGPHLTLAKRCAMGAIAVGVRRRPSK